MRLLLTAVLVTFALSAFGGTVIETKGSGGEIGKITIDGDWARIDDVKRDGSGYLLVDAKRQKFYMVVPDEHTIIEFSKGNKKRRQEVEAEFKAVGEGPEIAGYPTRKYELSADGKRCGVVMVSEDVAKIGDVRHLLSVLGSFSPDAFLPEEMSHTLRQMANPCDLAEVQLDEKLTGQVFPMKSVDADGKTRNEVTSIVENAKVDSKLFELPKEYTKTTVKQMMQGMRKEMENAMDKINEMMKDMSPEERARMEQMMKQFKSGSK